MATTAIRARKLFLGVVCLLATAGFSLPGRAQQALPDYTLNPGDQIDIAVWKELELTKTVIVRPDGKFSFPLAGEIQAAGRTIAQVLQLEFHDNGKLVGRVISEALPNGAVPDVTRRVVTSEPAANGLVTVLNMQMVGNTRYFDAAGFPGRTVGLSTTAVPSATQ